MSIVNLIMFHLSKKIIVILILAVVIISAIVCAYFLDFSRPMNWGVTFSPVYARDELGLDWREAYLAVLDDLKVDRIRLSAYWDEIENSKGSYDFTDLDFQVSEAGKRNVNMIVAVGRRLPRWPECHDPWWLNGMNSVEVEQRQLKFVREVIERYAGNENIIYWQV